MWRRNWWPRPAPSAAPAIRPGQVGDHEGLVGRARADHPEHRHQGGERIVGDLGAGGRHHRDQGRLAGVGQPDQADVGQQLRARAAACAPRPGCRDRPAAAPGWSGWRSGHCRGRRGRPGRPGGAGRPPSPRRPARPIPGRRPRCRGALAAEASNPRLAGAVRAFAVAAALRLEPGLEAEAEQGVEVAVAEQVDRAAVAAVAARRAARSTNFSRRKAMQPLPPPPASASIRASSMKFIGDPWETVADNEQILNRPGPKRRTLTGSW